MAEDTDATHITTQHGKHKRLKPLTSLTLGSETEGGDNSSHLVQSENSASEQSEQRQRLECMYIANDGRGGYSLYGSLELQGYDRATSAQRATAIDGLFDTLKSDISNMRWTATRAATKTLGSKRKTSDLDPAEQLTDIVTNALSNAGLGRDIAVSVEMYDDLAALQTHEQHTDRGQPERRYLIWDSRMHSSPLRLGLKGKSAQTSRLSHPDMPPPPRTLGVTNSALPNTYDQYPVHLRRLLKPGAAIQALVPGGLRDEFIEDSLSSVVVPYLRQQTNGNGNASAETARETAASLGDLIAPWVQMVRSQGINCIPSLIGLSTQSANRWKQVSNSVQLASNGCLMSWRLEQGGGVTMESRDITELCRAHVGEGKKQRENAVLQGCVRSEHWPADHAVTPLQQYAAASSLPAAEAPTCEDDEGV